ncbi:hypothetical protein [Streptomyces sp. NBC_00259]|uniref:hypothetical protein n=1 Tax=Streptomyces sp. NBC_00259 TaxID=2903643 RepID=UPI002E2B7022|nr:hypothetical protein [Streptomyces sp. NBC_00259]
MTAARRTAVGIAVAAVCFAGLTGCGPGGDGTDGGAAEAPVTTGPSEIGEMQKLVDAAESAAAEAESATADDD